MILTDFNPNPEFPFLYLFHKNTLSALAQMRGPKLITQTHLIPMSHIKVTLSVDGIQRDFFEDQMGKTSLNQILALEHRVVVGSRSGSP